MIHQINPYTGETVRTWGTGEYWIDHRSFIDLVLIDQLGGEESAKDFDLKRIAEIVLTSPATVDLTSLDWGPVQTDIEGQIYQNAPHPEDQEYTIPPTIPTSTRCSAPAGKIFWPGGPGPTLRPSLNPLP